MNIAPYRKALIGFLVTLAGSIGLALLDGGITEAEAFASLGVALATTAGVYQTKNGAPA